MSLYPPLAHIRTLAAYLRRQDGQTLAEYGILVTAIAVVVIVAAVVLGGSVSAMYHSSAVRL